MGNVAGTLREIMYGVVGEMYHKLTTPGVDRKREGVGRLQSVFIQEQGGYG